MAGVGEDGRGYLLPAGHKGCVFDVECGCVAESAVFDGGEELDVVMWGEFGVEPLFVEVDGDAVKGVGGSGVDPNGSGSEGGVACCGDSPQGLGDVSGEALGLQVL